MKVIINKTGKVEEVSEKVASRLINKGRAHPAKIDEITEVKTKPIKVVDKIPEVVREVDIIEPIPEQFVDWNEPMEKPKKKSRKKKSKLRKWDG